MVEINQASSEINFIKKIMEDSKRATVDNGMGFIVWGALALFGIILTYADYLLKTRIGSLYIWIAVFAAGIIYLMLLIARSSKRERVKTLAGSLLGAVWIGCLVVSVFILLLPLIVKDIPAEITLTSILFTIGIGYFVSGYIFDYKWIKYNGYVWWLGGFLNVFIIFPHSQMIILGLLLIFFQIVPGIVLYRKWKVEISQRAV